MTDPIEKLRKLAEAAQSESESWHIIDKHLDFAAVAKPKTILSLLDLVEAADRMYPYVPESDLESFRACRTYDTKRAALAKALEVTDG